MGKIAAAAFGMIMLAAVLVLAVAASNRLIGKPPLLRNDLYLQWIIDGNNYFVPSGEPGTLCTNPELVALDNYRSCFRKDKEPGTFRIFCVGGSVTAGWPFHQVLSFPRLMSLYFRDLLPDRKIEVVNAGFQASDSASDARIVAEIVRYRPDLVIASEGRTDFWNYSLHTARNAWLARLQVWMLRRVRLYALLRARFLPNEFNDARDVRERLARNCRYDPARVGRYFTGNLAAMEAAVRAHGGRLVLLTQLVHRDEPGNDTRFMHDINRWIDGFSREKGVPVADIDEAFRRSSLPADELIIPCSGVHPGIRGHALMARAVCRTLSDEGIIAPSQGWRWDALRSDESYLREAGLTGEFIGRVYEQKILPLFRKLGLSEKEYESNKQRLVHRGLKD